MYLPKLNQDDIINLDRSVMSNEVETILKSLPAKKSQRPNGFIV
jgi:hypothetical protein